MRQVLITGLKSTSPQLVARNILLNPGDPLSPNRMTETQRRLYDLGVFAKVDTAIQNPDGETDRKYVLYDMEEAAQLLRGGRFRRGNCAHRRLPDLPGRPGGAGRLRPARLLGFQPPQSLGPRPQPQPAHARLHARTTRAWLNYSWPRFRDRRPDDPLLHRPLR